MQITVKISRFIDNISEKLGSLSVYLVIITFLVGFTNVVLRYMGEIVGKRLTSNVFIELQWYLYTLIFFTSFAYILKSGIIMCALTFGLLISPKKPKLGSTSLGIPSP